MQHFVDEKFKIDIFLDTNVLVDYVLRINNNKLTKNFITAIASQWKRSNIEKVEDAMNIAHQEHNKAEVTKKKVSVKYKEEVKPDWFDKEIEVDDDIDKIKAMEEMLNGV